MSVDFVKMIPQLYKRRYLMQIQNIIGGKIPCGFFCGISVQSNIREIIESLKNDGFNLPCKYVIHTVGPIINAGFEPTKNQCALLASCYKSCLNLVAENNLASIAFFCISTGEFHFPNYKAAEIAVRTVSYWLNAGNSATVVFNVFKDADSEIYRDILGI